MSAMTDAAVATSLSSSNSARQPMHRCRNTRIPWPDAKCAMAPEKRTPMLRKLLTATTQNPPQPTS